MKKNNIDLSAIENYARNAYNASNCKYGDFEYFHHINMAKSFFERHNKIFLNDEDIIFTIAGIYCHDLIEDAKQTFNDIKYNTNSKEIADIVLAVTDIPAENRFLRGLYTIPKIVQNHRAIIVKLSDIYANTTHSIQTNSSMYKKYISENRYKLPIFTYALSQYSNKFNTERLEIMLKEISDLS